MDDTDVPVPFFQGSDGGWGELKEEEIFLIFQTLDNFYK